MTAGKGAFSALANRNFRLFFTGQLISLVGIWMHQVGLSWLVLDLTNSAFYVGLVNALDSAPVLLLALYAGVVADRMSRVRLVIITKIASMVLALTLAALVFARVPAIWPVMLIATGFGVVNAFDIPARHTLFGDLVGKEGLISAVALNSSSFNASRMVGPVIAGFVLNAGGAAWCFLLNGLSYIAVLSGLFAMKVPPIRPSAHPPASAWANMLEGLRYTWSERRTRGVVIITGTMTMFGAQFLVLLPVLARDVLGRGAEAYGWMMAAVGFGALAGALWVASYGRRFSRGRLMLVSSLSAGVLVFLLAFTRQISVVLLILTALGIVLITNGAMANTILQTLAPERLRGRVVSVYTLVAVGLAPVGAIEAGWVASKFGVPAALVVGGILCLVGVLAVQWRTPEVRATTDEYPVVVDQSVLSS